MAILLYAIAAVAIEQHLSILSSATVSAFQTAERNAMEGTWKGNFLQREWTFRLRHENGAWSGNYTRSDGRNWYPLTELVVSGTSIGFSIESTPKVSFSLQADAASQAMSGTVTIEGVATVPFSATRQP